MSAETISILDGSTFAVSNRAGDMDARPDQPHGFFYKDTRHLSRWVLTVNGVTPAALSTDTVEYYLAQFFLAPPTGTIYRDPSLSLIRRRLIGEGFVEEIILMNHGPAPAELVVRVEAGADFADLFEVKDALAKKGTLYREVRGGDLVLGYRRGDFVRETQVGSSEPAEVDGQALVFRVRVAAKSEWTTRLEVRPVTGGEVHVPKHRSGPPTAQPNLHGGLRQWVEGAPRVSAYPHHLARVYARSLVDLAALRFYPDILPGASVPAAGLPWFMALFGRDSLITSYQALPFVPELAASTLRVLAACQGKVVDDYREEEPGRILHELRFGELTAFGERPHSPYYGSADATPLFLVLLDEYERWTGDAALARELEGAARAALEWIDRFGDRDGDGYVEYQRKTEAGLDNQCWKDSWNSIVYPDGRLAGPTRPRRRHRVVGGGLLGRAVGHPVGSLDAAVGAVAAVVPGRVTPRTRVWAPGVPLPAGDPPQVPGMWLAVAGRTRSVGRAKARRTWRSRTALRALPSRGFEALRPVVLRRVDRRADLVTCIASGGNGASNSFSRRSGVGSTSRPRDNSRRFAAHRPVRSTHNAWDNRFSKLLVPLWPGQVPIDLYYTEGFVLTRDLVKTYPDDFELVLR